MGLFRSFIIAMCVFMGYVQCNKEYDCDENELQAPVMQKMTGCLNENLVAAFFEGRLSNRYNLNALTPDETQYLMLDLLINHVKKTRDEYDKWMNAENRKREKSEPHLTYFDQLTRAQTSVVVAINWELKEDVELKQTHDKGWKESLKQQDWIETENIIKDMIDNTEGAQKGRLQVALGYMQSTNDNTPCCPGPMHEGHCFFLGKESLSLDAARDECNREAKEISKKFSTLSTTESSSVVGDLAPIHKENVTKSLAEIINEKSWIGAFECTEIKKNGKNGKNVFVGTDEEEVKNSEEKAFWSASSDPGQCAVLIGTSVQSHSCEGEMPYVCALSMSVGSRNDLDKEKLKEIQKKAKTKDAVEVITDPDHCNDGDEFLTCDTRMPKSITTITPPVGSEKQKRRKRNAISDQYEAFKWPNGIVPYIIDDSKFTEAEALNISQAIESINAHTCIEMKQRDNEDQYVEFSRGVYGTTGCWAYIGRADPFGLGPFYINLGTGCNQIGTIQHEILHTLGFFHMHQRYDRDSYVKVLYENVIPGYEQNFDKIAISVADPRDVGYNPLSIMHYGLYSLSYNDLPTIVPLHVSSDAIGQRHFMTASDIAGVNILYDCPVPIDGVWGFWNGWSDCDKACGGGTRHRIRECDLPYPMNGGKNCEGIFLDEEECNSQSCTLSAVWAGCWKFDEENEVFLIDVTADGNLEDIDPTSDEFLMNCSQEVAIHDCDHFAIRDNKCFGYRSYSPQNLFNIPSDTCENRIGSEDSVDLYSIEDGQMQAKYGPWEEFGACSVSCGGGESVRVRRCNNPPVRRDSDDLDCIGPMEESEPCNQWLCPVNGGWGDWSEWSACSHACGVGQKVRTRECDNPVPANYGMDCEDMFGSGNETSLCNSGACGVDGCPVVYVTGPEPAELLDVYYFNASCQDGGVPGMVSELKLHNPDIHLYFEENSLTFQPDQKLDLEFVGTQPCVTQPTECKVGFGIELQLNRFSGQVDQTGERTEVVLSTGVNTDTEMEADESQGLVVYFSKEGDLRAVVKTAIKTYSVDLPAHYFEKDTKDTTHVTFVSWSQMDGLCIAYQGTWFDCDQGGIPHSEVITKVTTTITVGGAASCSKSQYFSGRLKKLAIYNNNDVDPSEPFTYLPFDCAYCDDNAQCNLEERTCACNSNYEGDGINYCTPIQANVDLPNDTPTYAWPKSFEYEYSLTSIPSFQPAEPAGNILYGRTYVREYNSTTDTAKPLIFNGLHDFVDAGNESPCYKDPEDCASGFTLSFNLVYHGRGDSYNFILSSGALPWHQSKGISMYVNNNEATVQVQTENHIERVKFPMVQGVRQSYVISWSPTNGLLVAVDSDVKQGEITDAPGFPNTYGRLVIGKPSTGHMFYPGRFEMDNFSFWEKSSNILL